MRKGHRAAFLGGGQQRGLGGVAHRGPFLPVVLRPAAEPEGFLVEKFKGPLQAGECDRARAWGASLASGLGPHPQAMTGGGGPQRPTRLSPGRGAGRTVSRRLLLAGRPAPGQRGAAQACRVGPLKFLE